MIYLKDSYIKNFEEKIVLVEEDKIITLKIALFMPKAAGNLEIKEYWKSMIKNSMLSIQLSMKWA